MLEFSKPTIEDKMRSKLAAAAFLAACTAMCTAQQQLNNQSVMKMHDAGMSDDLIATAINTQAGTYDTTMDGMIALKKAGIDDKLIQAMLVHSSAQNASLPPAAMIANAGGPPPTNGPHKPRVYVSSLGSGAGLLSLRNQSMEVSKDMERDCPAVAVTLNQANADYTVQLNHIEAGFFRDNQFQLADHNGDLVGTKIKGGASISGGVKRVCNAVLANWNAQTTPVGTIPPPTAAQPSAQ